MTMLRENGRDRIIEEATAWFNRIREMELPQAERARFAEWIAESPVHVREYLGVAETWGTLRSAAAVWPVESAGTLFDVIRNAQDPTVAIRDQDHDRRSHTRKVYPYAIAAGLALFAVILTWTQFRDGSYVYKTGRGEQRSVVLADGSVVQLNTLTKMIVRFDGQQRRVELPRGEAFFRVARDIHRPFEVETPFARVRAIGTEFNVYNHLERTRVAVVEGKVRVAARALENVDTATPSSTNLSSRTPFEAIQPSVVALGAQESIDVGAAGRIDKVKPPRVVSASQVATAWIQRRIVLDNDRVDKAVDEFNRYNETQMRVEDTRLAALRISGIFNADDPKALIKYLEKTQGTRISRRDTHVVLQGTE